MSGERASVASVNGTETPGVFSAHPKGQAFRRFFTEADQNPLDNVKWERRTSIICNAKGKTIFEQKDVEVPVFWGKREPFREKGKT